MLTLMAQVQCVQLGFELRVALLEVVELLDYVFNVDWQRATPVTGTTFTGLGCRTRHFGQYHCEAAGMVCASLNAGCGWEDQFEYQNLAQSFQVQIFLVARPLSLAVAQINFHLSPGRSPYALHLRWWSLGA